MQKSETEYEKTFGRAIQDSLSVNMQFVISRYAELVLHLEQIELIERLINGGKITGKNEQIDIWGIKKIIGYLGLTEKISLSESETKPGFELTKEEEILIYLYRFGLISLENQNIKNVKRFKVQLAFEVGECGITRTEMMLLGLICQGICNHGEIASKNSRSVSTIKNHLNNVYQKFNFLFPTNVVGTNSNKKLFLLLRLIEEGYIKISPFNENFAYKTENPTRQRVKLVISKTGFTTIRKGPRKIVEAILDKHLSIDQISQKISRKDATAKNHISDLIRTYVHSDTSTNSSEEAENNKLGLIISLIEQGLIIAVPEIDQRDPQ